MLQQAAHTEVGKAPQTGHGLKPPPLSEHTKTSWSLLALEKLSEVVTDMVEGAMASSISVACMPAHLHLTSSKSFLVTAVQSTMGESSALQ